MKKTYINPNIEVVKIASQTQMMAGSFTKDAQGNLTGGELLNGNATGSALGREFDFGEDDEY